MVGQIAEGIKTLSLPSYKRPVTHDRSPDRWRYGHIKHGVWRWVYVRFVEDGRPVTPPRRSNRLSYTLMRKGVSALLKQAAGQHVIPIHCMPHRLELASLNLQRNETMVAKVYDLLHLVWKTYHQSPKSRRELNLIGRRARCKGLLSFEREKGQGGFTHVHRALSVFLRAAKEGSRSTDSGQYSAVLRHMDHLASSAASAEIQGRAKKKNDLILPQAISALRKTVMVLQAMQETPA
ncbi:unnamed protein product [Boreogadus saida]